MADQRIGLSGRLICRDMRDVATVRAHLPTHIDLTLAEPGCLHFKVTKGEDPLIWRVEEWFVDREAFVAHQARTRASAWGIATADIPRDYQITGPSEPGA